MDFETRVRCKEENEEVRDYEQRYVKGSQPSELLVDQLTRGGMLSVNERLKTGHL